MLQEQNLQLSLALAQLAEGLDAVTARLEEAEQFQQRRFADQEVLVKNVSSDLSAIRERTQDTDTRLRSLSDEIDALRKTFLSLPGLITQALTPPPPVDPDATSSTGGSGATTPPGDVAPAPAPVVPLPAIAGLSPNRMYDVAFSDYSSGQYEVAINGFSDLVRTFPQAERADDALYLTGESMVYMGRFADAIAAYDRVIRDYPTGDQVDMAYFKRGLAQQRLGDVDAARASWEEVVKLHPDSTGARMASQRLIGLAQSGDPRP
jgi:tol-pal system protein YbgF